MQTSNDNPPQWVRYVIESQLNSEARLLNLESKIRKAAKDRRENDVKENIFEKKLYKDQYNFNRNVYEHLDRALQLVPEGSECMKLTREGMNILNNRNKQLKIADRFGWDPNLFVTADIRWGSHTVDTFSSFRTQHLPRGQSSGHHKILLLCL